MPVKPSTSTGTDGPAVCDRLAGVADQRADASPFRAGHDDVADVQRAALHQHGRHRAAAAVELGFDHGAFGGAFRIGLEVKDFRLKPDHLEQTVEVGLLGGGQLDVDDLAAERFNLHFVLQQLGAHALGLGVRLVDLVDRDDHRHLRRLGVIDRLDRLRHDAVVGRDHQHHDIGDLGAAGAHRGERGVARRVDEGDLAVGRRVHLVGADVLGDAAGFAAHDVGRADGVEQRGLAVVDVTHHGHDRRPRNKVRRIVGGVEHAFLDVGFSDALDGMAEFLGDELRGVGVDHVVDLRHLALLHQQLDDVDRALGHAVGEIGDADELRNRHLADQLFLRLVAEIADRAAVAAAERSGGALAHVVGCERGDEGEPPAGFLGGLRGARRPLRRRDRTGCAATGAAAERRPRAFFFLGLDHGACAGSPARSCFGFAKPLLRDFAGLALGFFLALVAIVFLALAALGGFALGALAGFADGAMTRFLFGDLALFGFAQARIAKRVGAAVALFVGEGAKHHARWLRRGRGRSSRRLRCGNFRGRLRRRGSNFGSLGLGARRAALLDLDDDLLAAAVAETLAHHARLGPRLERQRFGADAQRLSVRGLGIRHSGSSSCQLTSRP